MSETIPDTPVTEPTEPVSPPADTPAAPEAQAAPEAASEATPEPEQKAAEPPVSKRIGNLTRKLTDEARRAEAERQARLDAERRLAAAEALLRQARGEEPGPTMPHQPVQDVEARAEALMQQRMLNSRLADIDAKGRQEIGAETWDLAKQTMTGYGAVANEAFLHALAETDNGHRIFAELAEDPEKLTALLSKPPAAMAATLGKMDAKLATPETPKPRPTSNAPRPPTPVSASSTPPPPDLEALAKAGDVDAYVAALRKEYPNSRLFR